MGQYRLLGISGALREGSTNTALVREAMRIFDPADRALADLRLPLFDQDDEGREGIPPAVQRLADQIAAADGIVISTPEYNRVISGVLKNALDWVSRTKGRPWRDKPVAIMSAADGWTGGARAQYSLRLAMVVFAPRLIGTPEVMIPHSGQAFDADGRLRDKAAQKVLGELMDRLRDEITRGQAAGLHAR